jgi:hypothetical protein
VEIQVVENRLRVDIGRCIGEFVGARGEAELPVRDAVTQGPDREAVDGHDHIARRVLHRESKVAVDRIDGMRHVAGFGDLPPGHRGAIAQRQIGQRHGLKIRGADGQRMTVCEHR